MPGQVWFRAKRYGWGWTPVTWQGWAITAAYAIVVVGWVLHETLRPDAMIVQHDGLTAWLSALPILVLTAALVAICRIKDERPRWRWGK